jgi:hypothetical protein
MTPENSSALLRKYSPSPGEKFPFLRPADTGFPRALGWSFFTLFFLILDLILCIVMPVKNAFHIR